jgi:tRNA pseudouridine13 synthase
LTGAAEQEAGIDRYATSGPPCQCRAKSFEGDFGVEEKVSLGGLTNEWKAGYFPLYRVEKRSIDTMHMARELSGALKSRVSYGGLKDKRAVSVQYVTPTSSRAARPAQVLRDLFVARLVGYVPRPMSRGSVLGNRFEIILRGCCPGVESRIEETMLLAAERKVPNFYGLQRFGATGPGTHRMGKALVRGMFEEAVRLMLGGGRTLDDRAADGASEATEGGTYEVAGGLLPRGRDVERRVALELRRHPGEWVRALRAVPVQLRRLYVHAYQSFIFNRTLSMAMAKGEDISKYHEGDNWAGVHEDGLVTSEVGGVKDQAAPGAVPMVQLVGFAYRDYGSRFDACIREVLDSEGVAPGQFYVRGMEEVSSEGSFRRPHIALKDPSWKVEEEVATLGFTLARGQYATILLREIIKPEDPPRAGLA